MPFITVGEATKKRYDYIIVGGGTSGLVIASRLSEDSNSTVLVVEAGESHMKDPSVDVPSNFGTTLKNEKYAWQFWTAKQPNADDREIFMPRGRGLGGSSNVNLFCWTKPPAADIDAIETLGNPGWNWDDFKKYSKRSETFHPPQDAMIHILPGLTFDPENRGSEGPVQIAFPPQSYTMHNMVKEAVLQTPGVGEIEDPTGGNTTGTWMSPSNIDPRERRRITSASGYLFPNMERENLHVLTLCQASRVLFQEGGDSNDGLVATGVEFINNDQLCTVQGSNIVICTGTINAPQILELSGIGNPEVLSNIGVDVKIDLPGVGENLQEHTMQACRYELRSDAPAESFSLFSNDRDYETLARETYEIGAGYRLGVTSHSFIPIQLASPESFENTISRAKNVIQAAMEGGRLPPGLKQQYDIQLANLMDPSLPDHQVVLVPGTYPDILSEEEVLCGKRFITLAGGQHHPFSRGSIHAVSRDPTRHPCIDPRYLSMETDFDLAVADLRLIRKIVDTEPLKSAILREVIPGPDCITDEDLIEFTKKNMVSMWHTIGTCSMLPREMNGVVDPSLKVYGTSNVYVADLSIIPLHFAAHSQTVAYAIGEKAADILKNQRGEAH